MDGAQLSAPVLPVPLDQGFGFKNGILPLLPNKHNQASRDVIPPCLALLLIPQSQDQINELHTELLEGSALFKPQKHLQQQSEESKADKAKFGSN